MSAPLDLVEKIQRMRYLDSQYVSAARDFNTCYELLALARDLCFDSRVSTRDYGSLLSIPGVSKPQIYLRFVRFVNHNCGMVV